MTVLYTKFIVTSPSFHFKNSFLIAQSAICKQRLDHLAKKSRCVVLHILKGGNAFFPPFKLSSIHFLATAYSRFVDFVPVFHFCLDSNAMHYAPKDSPDRLRRRFTRKGESSSASSVAYGDQDPSLSLRREK